VFQKTFKGGRYAENESEAKNIFSTQQNPSGFSLFSFVPDCMGSLSVYASS
jgi:hypothetical protein